MSTFLIASPTMRSIKFRIPQKLHQQRLWREVIMLPNIAESSSCLVVRALPCIHRERWIFDVETLMLADFANVRQWQFLVTICASSGRMPGDAKLITTQPINPSPCCACLHQRDILTLYNCDHSRLRARGTIVPSTACNHELSVKSPGYCNYSDGCFPCMSAVSTSKKAASSSYHMHSDGL